MRGNQDLMIDRESHTTSSATITEVYCKFCKL